MTAVMTEVKRIVCSVLEGLADKRVWFGWPMEKLHDEAPYLLT